MSPDRTGVSALVGVRAGGGLRRAVADAVPADQAAGTPLYLLLDDLAGASLVAGFAWSQWAGAIEGAPKMRTSGNRSMVGLCVGFRPGSSGLTANGSSRWTHQVQAVPPLPAPDDPIGWHALPETTEVSLRRARRIDVTLEDNDIVIDSHFQDSCTRPPGGRVAVHEYLLKARASRDTGRLTFLDADPRVLPYDECPLAVLNTDALIGVPLSDLRTVVLERLAGTLGCTHLNDALRALAEVPVLAATIGA